MWNVESVIKDQNSIFLFSLHPFLITLNLSTLQTWFKHSIFIQKIYFTLNSTNSFFASFDSEVSKDVTNTFVWSNVRMSWRGFLSSILGSRSWRRLILNGVQQIPYKTDRRWLTACWFMIVTRKTLPEYQCFIVNLFGICKNGLRFSI